jgi:glutathione S-transferase
MANVRLIVGDVSTWSMRAWMSLKLAKVDFDELVIPLGKLEHKQFLTENSDSLLVPVLISNKNKIHDSMAIAEFVNEMSNGLLFPNDQYERAECRSLCAELHSGFVKIRTLCPYSIEGGQLSQDTQQLEPELTRLKAIWSAANGQFFYKEPSLFDAYYVVMAHRLAGYGIIFDGDAGEYQENIITWDLFDQSLKQAKKWRSSGV